MADNYITNYNGSISALSQNLDVNGQNIQGAEVSIRTNASNGDIIIQPNGTGDVIINGFKFPRTDGNQFEFLQTDGSGNLAFNRTPVGGGGSGSGNYYWQIAADDSTAIPVLSDNIIKFIGGDGITTATDQDGNLTLNQAPQNFSVTGEASASAVSYNGTGAVALNVTLDHNALDDQYLRLDGTTQPAGAINFNSQNITNGGTFTASSFVGALTGNVQGDVTGDVTGNVSGTAGAVDFPNVTNKPTTVAGYGITDALALSSLSVGADASASGSGGIAFNDSSGVFTYTPPDLSSYLTAESDTLDLVTDRGATTTNNITVGSVTTTGTNTLVGTEIKIVGNKIETINSNSNINLEPAGTGVVEITSGVTVPDTKTVVFGNGNSIASNGTGVLETSTTTNRIKADTFEVKNSANDETLLTAANAGPVTLYYDNSSKLNTTNTGVNIGGGITVQNDVEATGNLGSANLTSGRVTFATTGGVLTDNAKLTFNGATLDINGSVDATVFLTEGLRITQNDISSTRSNEPLTIAANGTGNVQIDDPTIIGATLQTTVGGDGGGSGLPATPVTYLRISINGTEYKIPLYNT
tara:strand:+ start:346 stop:2094 length:1749 start_codon:yes stop_codon:yes gene_type:complete